MRTNFLLYVRVVAMLVTFSVVLNAFGCTLVCGAEIDVQSFKNDAVKKWQDMFEVADSYDLNVEIKLIENDTVVRQSRSESAVLFPCSYMERNEDGRIIVNCHNNKYGFTLQKEDEDSDWEIQNVRKYDHELVRKRDWRMRHCASFFPTQDRFERHYTDEEMDRGLYSMVCNSSEWGQINPSYLLPCLFTDSDFKITSITEIVNEDGFPCYNVEFNYKPGSEHNLLNVKEGRIELDRKNYAIRRAVYKWGPTDYNIQDVTLSYAEKDDVGFPLVTKRVLRDIENGKLRHIEEIEYDYRPVTNLTEDRFKLSYYGFPEPIFEDDAKFDVRWYFLIGGCFFIALAVLITRRRRSEPERQDADDVLAG